MRLTTPLLVAATLLVATGCDSQSAEETTVPVVSFTGSDNVRSDIVDTSRIVTLSGDLTEFVYELGAGGSVVGTDVTTVYPAEAVALPKVGVGRFLSSEAVLAQDPTLVIGDTQTSPTTAIDQIRSAGVPVVILETSTSFEAMYTKIKNLGVLLDSEDAATELADQLTADIASASSSSPVSDASPRVAYVYTRGPDVMLLFGSDMVTNPIIEASGGTDAGVVAGVHGSIPVTPEALIAAAPDVIIVPAEGLDVLGGIDGLIAIPGVAETPAGVNRAILAYPEGDFLTLGPRIATSVAQLTDDLAGLGPTP